MARVRVKRQRTVFRWKCHIPPDSTVVFRRNCNLFLGKVVGIYPRNAYNHKSIVVKVQGNYLSQYHYNLLRVECNTNSYFFNCSKDEDTGIYRSDETNSSLTVLDPANETHQRLVNWRSHLNRGTLLWFRSDECRCLMKTIVCDTTEDTILLYPLGSAESIEVSRHSQRIQPVIDSTHLKIIRVETYLFPHMKSLPNNMNVFLGSRCFVSGLEGRIVDVDVSRPDSRPPLYCWCQTTDQDESFQYVQDFALYRNVKWVTEDEIQLLTCRENILPDRPAVFEKEIVLDFVHRMVPGHIRHLLKLQEHDPSLCWKLLLRYAKDEYTPALKVFYGIAHLEFTLNSYINKFEYDAGRDSDFSFMREMMLKKMAYYTQYDYMDEKNLLLQRYNLLFNNSIITSHGSIMLNYEGAINKVNLLKFNLVKISEVDPTKLQVRLKCTYSGLYSSDINHYLSTHINVNIMALRPLMFQMFKRELARLRMGDETCAFDLKHHERRLGNLFQTESKTYMSENKIESLLRHQSFVVSKMVNEETSNDPMSDFYNLNIHSEATYNAICGFIPTEKNVKCNGGILALRTGWGKTICIIELLKRRGGKTLIVAPLSLIDQWKHEFKRFAPEIEQSEYYGKRKKICDHVNFTTYGTLRTNALNKYVFDRVVFDESHIIKKPESMTAIKCHRIQAKNRWLLSATPFDENLVHTQTQLKLLRVTPFDRRNVNMVQYQIPLKAFMNRVTFALSKDIVKSMGLNPMKKSVNTPTMKNVSLPAHVKTLVEELRKLLTVANGEDIYSNLSFLKNRATFMQQCCIDPSILPLSAFATRNISKEMQVTKEELILSVEKSTSLQTNYKETVINTLKSQTDGTCVICLDEITAEKEPTILPCLHMFCKACIHEALKRKTACPQCRRKCEKSQLKTLVEKHINTCEDGDITYFTDLLGHSYSLPTHVKRAYEEAEKSIPQKFKAINAYLTDTKKSCVIFSQYPKALQNLSKYLEKENSKHFLISGATSRKKRSKLVQEFKDGGVKTLLLSVKTAAVGLNLQEGSVVIFLEPIMNYEDMKQSIGRLHRIGQRNDIDILALCTDNTYESKFEEVSKKCRKRQRSINREFSGREKRYRERVVKRDLYNYIFKS